jgi:hypothetical protein
MNYYFEKHQVGSHFPQVLGESITKSKGFSTKVLGGLTTHRSDALFIFLDAVMKNQLKILETK